MMSGIRVFCATCGVDTTERAGCGCAESVEVAQIGTFQARPANPRQVRYTRVVRALLGAGMEPWRANRLALDERGVATPS